MRGTNNSPPAVPVFFRRGSKVRNFAHIFDPSHKILRVLQMQPRDVRTVQLYKKYNTLPIPELHNTIIGAQIIVSEQ